MSHTQQEKVKTATMEPLHCGTDQSALIKGGVFILGVHLVLSMYICIAKTSHGVLTNFRGGLMEGIQCTCSGTLNVYTVLD